jgi:hypothetical protein
MMGKKEYYEFDSENGQIEQMPEHVVQKALEEAGLKVNKWKVFKQVVGCVASGCASIVVSKYLKAQVGDSMTLAERIVSGIGVYFITGVVGSAVGKYAEQELEDWKETIMTVKDELEESRN